MNGFTCPNCGSENAVSAYLEWERGHHSVSYTTTEVVGHEVEKIYNKGDIFPSEINKTPIYGQVQHTRTVLTPLAKRISPPPMPLKPSMSRKTGCLFKLASSFGIAVTISIIAAVMIWATLKFFTYKVETPILFLIEIMIAMGIAFPLNKMLENKYFAKIGRFDEYEQQLKEYNAEMEQYKKDFAQWKKLYVCQRCGMAFYVD